MEEKTNGKLKFMAPENDSDVYKSVSAMESSIIILNSFNGNFYFSNPARNNNPVRILVMQYKTLHRPSDNSCEPVCF